MVLIIFENSTEYLFRCCDEMPCARQLIEDFILGYSPRGGVDTGGEGMATASKSRKLAECGKDVA